jgi:hypothetical protein
MSLFLGTTTWGVHFGKRCELVNLVQSWKSVNAGGYGEMAAATQYIVWWDSQVARELRT